MRLTVRGFILGRMDLNTVGILPITGTSTCNVHFEIETDLVLELPPDTLYHDRRRSERERKRGRERERENIQTGY